MSQIILRKTVVSSIWVIPRLLMSLFLFMLPLQVVLFDLSVYYIGTEPDNPLVTEGGDFTELAVGAIPNSTLQRWRKTDFLVVMGIPTEDLPARRRRRDLQRKTCWTYDGVARRDNNYAGSMLVLYTLARSPSNNFDYSPEVKAEAEKWHDVLLLPLKEGKKTTLKEIGGEGFWGIEAEIGMSRKAYFWYYMADKLFPLASYIAKADDDIFLRVPKYLATLRVLPERGLYWGFGDKYFFTNYRSLRTRIHYSYGMCITLSANLIEQFLMYKPIRELAHTPYSKSLNDNFLSLRMDHEDLMLGIVLYLSGYRNIVYAMDKSCHLHNIYTADPIDRVTSDSMVIHHIKESEYEIFMNMFSNVSSSLPPEFYRDANKIVFVCRSDLPTLYPYVE